LAAALYFSPGRQAYVSGANQAATAGRTGFQSGQNSIARLRRWPLEDGAMDGRNAQLAVIPDDVAVKRPAGPFGHCNCYSLFFLSAQPKRY
jgi:hypothetical protein